VINARDGKEDRVNGSGGFDRARIDHFDLIVGIEEVF
jgi:hypothetical protein